ncbi:MAG TPA: hypothetical protein VK611_17060 [Acidimicrobiales bacterium]|nr:hypothetical protein [Acidimicrobiales bacterium]
MSQSAPAPPPVHYEAVTLDARDRLYGPTQRRYAFGAPPVGGRWYTLAEHRRAAAAAKLPRIRPAPVGVPPTPGPPPPEEVLGR